MMIFPALVPPPTLVGGRTLGRPRTFRWRRVSGRVAGVDAEWDRRSEGARDAADAARGGGVGRGDGIKEGEADEAGEEVDEDEEPGADNSGVDSSTSTSILTSA